MEKITALSNPPAERALVGMAMVRPSAFDDADCSAEEFEIPLARAAWEAIAGLRRAGHDVTPISVRESLPKRAADGETLATLLAWAQEAGYERAEALARIIRKAAAGRRLAASCAQAISDLGGGGIDVEAVLAEHRAAIAGIESADRDEPVRLRDAMAPALEEIEARAANRGAVGIETGIKAYDRAIGGFRAEQHVVVAARPGEGKSSFALGTCMHTSIVQETPVMIVTLEMSMQEEIERTLAGESHVSATRMATGRLEWADWQKVTTAARRIAGIPLWLYDKNVTLQKLESLVRRWHARNVPAGKVALVVVDYLGLVKAKEHKVREQEIAAISRAGKTLAKDLKAVVMQVAQLNRESEKQMRDPMLSDLRESGAIEQDANVVIFPVRDKAGEDIHGKGNARLIVAKNRGGPVGEVPAFWNGPLTKYQDRDALPEDADEGNT